ncbi:jg21856 [Pararge aegeria aegeria]|uniref:Jg21856 protein n=1 Tax=Pararge aegeria aegeria TaxID=348720 RepID=A0A8S4QKU7_9NEOP|nr:jg21856 [Pararge aegeria aegeria]
MIRQTLKFRKTVTIVCVLSLIIFIFLILRQDKLNTTDIRGPHQRRDNDIGYRDFNKMPKEDHIIKRENVDMEGNRDDSDVNQELQEAKARLALLEKKIAILEGRIPQKYPDVKYLGYKERKRILVSVLPVN